MRSKMRDPISAISHFAGALAAVPGLLILLHNPNRDLAWVVSSIIYGLSLFFMFLASAVYHTVRTTPKVTEIFRKVDHSAIYLLIAGTYTPFCVNAFSGFWQWGFLSIIWGLALVGIVVKVFFLHAPRWITAGVYVLMGWLSVFAVGEMVTSLPAVSIVWLVVGGVTYTLGAVVYITKRLDFIPGLLGFHEIWHVFVILGALAHYMAIFHLMPLL